MSQINPWKSIKGFPSQFPSLAALLQNISILTAGRVSPIFSLPLEFLYETWSFSMSLGRIGVLDTPSSPLVLGCPGDQVLVTLKSKLLNQNKGFEQRLKANQNNRKGRKHRVL